jgi:hypothetical protein
MKSRKYAVLALAATVLCTGLVATAAANNLDRDTATDAAREVARRDCRDTSGCKSYRVFGLHRVSRHKAIGKIEVISVKNQTRFSCVRQVVIKLDHFTGEINFATSARRCDAVGPA